MRGDEWAEEGRGGLRGAEGGWQRSSWLGELAGAHTDAQRKRIRCSDGCLNRLIGPALGEIGDRWREGQRGGGQRVRLGGSGESRGAAKGLLRDELLIRGAAGRAAANQSRAGRPGDTSTVH